MKLEYIENIFKENDVSGIVLLQITEDDLVNHFKIHSYGIRKILINQINILKGMKITNVDNRMQRKINSSIDKLPSTEIVFGDSSLELVNNI